MIRVGVRERAAYGRHVTDPHGRHAAERLGQDWKPLLQKRREFRLAMRDQGPQANRAVGRVDPSEPLNVTQAHDTPRAHQVLSQHGHEGGATRDDSRVVAVFPEGGKGLLDRPRRAIVERVHARLR